MRLTLRTLLAYLDDTLEPSQAKIIGQKVAESDQARELMEHIKQVTRQRRVATSPANNSGGKFDPNTLAEYLDGAVSPEQAGEVEQICLGSDAHLAEVAACHQILALVLGEPALVPPTAKTRMYGLVKGRESIPFRRPPSTPSLSAEHEAFPGGEEADETLRMGLPSARANSRGMQYLLLLGACIAAGTLLVLAIYHVLNQPGNTDQNVRPPGNQVVQAPQPVAPGGKEKPDKTAPPVENKVPPKVEPPPQVKKEIKPSPEPMKNHNSEPPPKENPPQLPPPSQLLPDYRFFEPDNHSVRLGKYLMPTAKDPTSIVVGRPVDNLTPWKRLWGTQDEVWAGRTYVALPGCKGELQLERGLQLTLWGNIPEILPGPPLLFESVVDLHSHDAYDVDLTLQRGRIVLTSTKDKPAIVRVRFENPSEPKKVEVVDLALQGKGSQLLIDRCGAYPPGVPFVKDPASPDRVPPTVFVGFLAMQGQTTLRLGDTTHALAAPPGSALVMWNSVKGLAAPTYYQTLPDVVSANPPPPPGLDPKARADILKARDDLSQLMMSNGLDVALPEMMKDGNIARRVMVVRCYAAVGDLARLVEFLDDSRKPEVRVTAIRAMQNWITLSRDNEYKLFEQLKTRFSKPGDPDKTAEKVMELLHGFGNPDLLVDYLNNPSLVIRQIAHMNLIGILPKGLNIPYDPSMEPAQRVGAQQAWRDLLRKEANGPPLPGPMGP